MKFNVHAGHNPAGRIACGATGILDESKENRKVRDYLIKFLRAQGNTVYDCTCDNGKNQNDVLKKIVAKCNAHSGIACDISLHLNAGGGHGAECEIYGTGGNAEKYAKKIQSAIVNRTGYTNRGVKVRKDLYVLRKTTAPAVLVECCFVDNSSDAKRWNPQTMAAAICEGLTGVNPLENKPSTQTKPETPTKPTEEKIVYKTIKDIPEWYRPTVQKCIDNGGIKGTGNGELNLTESECRTLTILDNMSALSSATPVVYKTINDVPEYYRDAVQKLIDKGAIKGTGKGELNISEDICRSLTILDRAHLLDAVTLADTGTAEAGKQN